MTDILFTSATDTLFELLGDKKYLGAKPGIIASLHTWDKTLLLHPHLHCLTTGGGLTDSKEWSSIKGGNLLPFRAVRKLFRGKILARIRKALRGRQTDPS
ncbi:MAG: transposase [Thermodesulfobacteriota bacterium]|nr:transposase [Thermodesulfobacteriota bacterium]